MRLSPSPDLWTLLWIVLLFNAMGCIQSIRCKPKSFRDSIIVLEVNTSIDSNPTSIDESSSVVLRYRTPHFRAFARVLVPPVACRETWTIGWIQACNHMEFYNTYGNKGMWVSRCLFVLFCGLCGQALTIMMSLCWGHKDKTPLTLINNSNVNLLQLTH